MTILEKLEKAKTHKIALEQKKLSLEEELKSVEASLVETYGQDWEAKYEEEKAKLEAWDDSIGA